MPCQISTTNRRDSYTKIVKAVPFRFLSKGGTTAKMKHFRKLWQTGYEAFALMKQEIKMRVGEALATAVEDSKN
jgi:hypothetical protein